MKILTVLGARPQFIKAGSVSREIQRQEALGRDIHEVIVHTGQHYDSNMSDIFFDEMKIPKPDYFLGIGGNSHGAMTGQMIESIEKVLISEKPDWLMVYGDTNSTLAGAIAASKLHIKIAHVEAGLRSFNSKMPEEINRILTDRISRVLFCPTRTAVNNLEREGVSLWNNGSEVVYSGDVMLDGALFYKRFAEKPNVVEFSDDFVLCTIHRAENTDDPLRLSEIFFALSHIAKDATVILPLHPRTRKVLEQYSFDLTNIVVIDPVGYLNMIWLIDNCKLVVTDSGGLQKEAFFFAKPCITIRDETEWVELVDHGFNVLAGATSQKIINSYYGIDMSKDFCVDLYGNGNACRIIVDKLLHSV